MNDRVTVVHDEDKQRILLCIYDKLIATLRYDEARKVRDKIDKMLPKEEIHVTAFMQSLNVDETPLPHYPYSAELTLKLVNLSLENVATLREAIKKVPGKLRVTLRPKED